MEFKHSVLVPYSAEDMFDLIEGAEHYPEFLPYCTGVRILERSDDWVAARLEFNYHHLRFGFSTRNPKRRPEWLQVCLTEGPFRRLHGEWTLKPLGDQGCKVTFEMSYELADGLLDRMALPAVEAAAHHVVGCFTRRADALLTPCDRKPKVAAPVPEMPPPAPVPVPVATPEPVPAPIAAPAPAVALETTMTPVVDSERLDAVRACRLAAELSPEQTLQLAELMTMQRLPAGQLVAAEGSADSRLYAIVSGTLAVVKARGQPEEQVLATLGARDLVHELGFIDGAPRYASLVATTDARVLVLEKAQLEGLLEREPRVVWHVMCAIVRAVHEVQRRLSLQASELAHYVYKTHGRY